MGSPKSARETALLGVWLVSEMPIVRPPKDDPHFGVDSRWSWISACFCAWVLFLASATSRVAGIFFYGIVEAFGVSRQEASWPVSLAGTLMMLAGPVAGALCKRFSCHTVLITCSCLAGIAVSLCYVANTLTFITIFFGILHGSAISGMYVAANVLVAQHFEERRAMACSLVYAASGLSNFVLPPLVEFFRTTYGIRAAFLLYGAIFLNALPPAIVLKSPPWLTNSKTVPEKVVPKADVKKNGTCTCSVVCRENMTLSNTPQNPPFYTQRQPLGNEAVNPSSGVKENSSCAHLCPEKASQKVPEATKFLSRLNLGHTAKQFVTCSFIVYALSFASITFTTGAFVLISADLAVDRGVSPSNSVYFLQAFAVADVAFRAAAGFAIDSSMLSVESTMLLGYVLQGLAYEWLAWASTLPPMIAAAAVLGVTSGSRLSLQAPALVHNFGIGNLPTMMGAVSFCAGASLLMRPLLIGYYRDNFGDYSGLLHTMAVINAVFVCLWMAKLVTKRRTKTTLKLEPYNASKTDVQYTETYKHYSGFGSTC